ncbi:CPBP family intramembrane glutamic endopeptidase [Dactylosporangium sp. NPDC049525]|uniref:CPBP family intramembrane glutamic endopeptidase n=1 Tax=Dactylosporangium sp. NPDC049525 TaxID=3154730 RepID=UPI003424235A
MFEWIDPRFDVAGACLTLLVLVTCVAAGARGATAKARAARERLVAAPGGRIRLYRTGVRTSAMLAVAAFAVVWTDGVDLVDLGLRAPVAGDAVVAGLVSAVFVSASVGGAVRVARARRDGTGVRGGRSAEETLARVRFLHPATPAERWLAGLLAVSVGVAEELVYRGLFIAAGTGLLGLDPWVAALLSLAVFGVDHLYQGWRGALVATLLGLVFTMLYASTGSIVAPIAVHALFDVAALVVAPWLAQHVERRPSRTPATAPTPEPVAAEPVTAPEPVIATAPPAARGGPVTLRPAAPE